MSAFFLISSQMFNLWRCQRNISKSCDLKKNVKKKLTVAFWASLILILEDFSSCPSNPAASWHLAQPVDSFLPASAAMFVVRQPIIQDKPVQRWKEGWKEPLFVPAPDYSKLHLSSLWKC